MPCAASLISKPPSTAPAQRMAAAGPELPRWRSHELFGPRREIEIEHGDAVYRLRITALGKLILTK